MKVKKFCTTNEIFENSIFENLYPDEKPQRVILRTGKIIHKSEETKEYNFFDYYNDHCKNSYFGGLKEPYMIYTGLGKFSPLENLEYDQSVVDYLNINGLKIFLYEVLIPYFDSNPITEEGVSSDIIFNFEYNKGVDKIYCAEFESIKIFIKKNKLTNVSVYTCENNTREIFENAYPEFKIFSANSWTTSYDYNHIENLFQCNSNYELIEKKFISLSLRYEVNKHLITMYLLEKESKSISWHDNDRLFYQDKSPPLDYLNSQLSFDLNQWKIKYPRIYRMFEKTSEILYSSSPIWLDCEKDLLKNQKGLRCGTEMPLPFEAFQKSFCHIICETKFGQPFGCFSEKVFHPMISMRPFIVVSTPHTLEYLKMHNFMTFDRWWDESYDDEEDHEKRILKIFKLIDYVDSLSVDQMKLICKEMESVFLHNRRQMFEIRKQLKIF